jgi:hypothetical protein
MSMTDPYPAPPRRPVPERLQQRVAQELGRATAKSQRRGRVAIPLLAAAVATTTVAVGVTALRDRERVSPAETATAIPATVSPTPTTGPSATATRKPTPKPVLTSLDVRPMTRAEIAADRRSCVRQDKHSTDLPYRGEAAVQYAMVQRSAGAAGGGPAVRVLLMSDDVGHWDCHDGQQDGWTRGPRTSAELTSRVPVAPATNANGGSGAACGGKNEVVRSSAAFFVGRAVRTGRIRIVRGDQPGPWLIAKPAEGLIHFLVRLTGPAAGERNVRMELTFLDRGGRPVAIESFGSKERGVESVAYQLTTCADLRTRFPRPKAVGRPSSDAAGIRICQAMADESAENSDVPPNRKWRSRLLVSTGDEWGTVLSDGRHLVGCSLYPTKEISPVVADTPTLRKSAFSFAVNPIGSTGAQSLWAAGRVPADVSSITYRLPGNRDVRATIDDDGYWMLKHHSADGEGIGTEENVADWPPVVVTVARASGTQRYTIGFSQETMCRQVSHGC